MVAEQPKALDAWSGEFGDRYTERNAASADAVRGRARVWAEVFGAMGGDLPASALEVGPNVGLNLLGIGPVSDGVRLSQWESRELQVQPLQTRGVPQLLQVLNSARKNNRLYVRLITRDGGAIVKGEPLTALPPSVLAVMEADRSGGSFRPLQSAVLGEWEIPTDLAVSGSRTLTLPLED